MTRGANVEWVYDDGGRSKYFKAENVGDCVCRAIAIATEQDYKKVYSELARINKKRYGKRSARNGISRDDIKAYMTNLGWQWHPTMGIGTGCTVHMDEDELPSGHLLCSLSRHMVAVIDGVCHDTYDSTRGGTRCVYGYWTKPKKPEPRITAWEFADMLETLRIDFEAGLMSAEEFGRMCEMAAMDRSGR